MSLSIQVMRYNSLIVAGQNVPVTSIFHFTLTSSKDFEVGLSLIDSKEMIWITSYEYCWVRKTGKQIIIRSKTCM